MGAFFSSFQLRGSEEASADAQSAWGVHRFQPPRNLTERGEEAGKADSVVASAPRAGGRPLPAAHFPLLRRLQNDSGEEVPVTPPRETFQLFNRPHG